MIDGDRVLAVLWSITTILMGVWVVAVERENGHLRQIDVELSKATAFCLSHYDTLQQDLDFTISLYRSAIGLSAGMSEQENTP